jgi:hypothetical protein
VLQLAREMGVLKMGTIGLDGTKIHANASRHSAISYQHAGKIEHWMPPNIREALSIAEDDDFKVRSSFRANAELFARAIAPDQIFHYPSQIRHPLFSSLRLSARPPRQGDRQSRGTPQLE